MRVIGKIRAIFSADLMRGKDLKGDCTGDLEGGGGPSFALGLRWAGCEGHHPEAMFPTAENAETAEKGRERGFRTQPWCRPKPLRGSLTSAVALIIPVWPRKYRNGVWPASYKMVL